MTAEDWEFLEVVRRADQTAIFGAYRARQEAELVRTAPRNVNGAIPRTPEGLAETLADPQRAQATMDRLFPNDPDAWQRFHAAYAQAAGSADPSLDQQVREQTQRVLGQMLRENGAAPVDLSPAAGRRGRRVALYDRRAPGAALDSRFEDIGEFAAAVWHGNRTPDGSLLRDIRNAFGSTVPADGGFLIPERLRSDLLVAAMELGVVRPRATIVPMDSLRVPFPTIDESSHVSSVFGGLVGAWTEEGAQMTPTQASFGRVVLDAKKLTCYGEAPNELFQDGGATFTAFLEAALPATLAFYEDRAFLTGSGVGEPLGVLNASARISVNRTTANKIIWEDILAMAARLLPQSWRRAVWVASNETIPELGQLAVRIRNQGNTDFVGGSAVWITDGADDRPTAILGRPLIFSEKVSQLGTAGDLCLVDFGFYLLGDRRAMSLETSAHYKFQNDVTSFRCIERCDGRPWINSALTPANGGDTLSPYVRLN